MKTTLILLLALSVVVAGRRSPANYVAGQMQDMHDKKGFFGVGMPSLDEHAVMGHKTEEKIEEIKPVSRRKKTATEKTSLPEDTTKKDYRRYSAFGMMEPVLNDMDGLE